MDNTIEIMDAGVRDSFDYTVWQREYFDKMESSQILEEAIKYVKEHPYKGNATIIKHI